MITEKPWGTTECLLQTPFIEVHRIIIGPRASCSWHKHEKKWNAFLLKAGSIDIEHEVGELISGINLRDMNVFYTVPPGDFHRFVTGAEMAIAYELYYPDLLSEDIVRKILPPSLEKLT